MSTPLDHRSYGRAQVHIFPSKDLSGRAAASRAAGIIRDAISKCGRARIVVATGNSQLELIDALTHKESVDWDAVEAFHMDEYVGIAADHPASFRHWIRNRVELAVHPAQVHYIVGDAPDLDAEIRRYTSLLFSGPIHLAFVGFGENGHIAFNDPAVADFADPALLKRATLDDACRRQQVGEGHFPNVAAVPREALTITCSGLFRSEAWVCSVPDARKAEAVRNACEGPISAICPASIVRTHPNASVYLDAASAALLSTLTHG
jgi:glucosamine-6-phosphate deaminase